MALARVARAGGLAYWTARAQELGARAVVNLDHPAERDLEAVTARHRAVLLPALAARLDGSERVVCDLGSGTGRFTADLAALVGGRAVGVEPVAALRSLSPPCEDVVYRGLDEDGGLPLADAEADVLVTMTVLGGLLEPGELARVAAEVRRVLRPGGLLCLAESVADGSPRDAAPHWAPRTVASYRSLFRWAALEEVARFDDAGDSIAVLVGRQPTSASG